MGKPQEELEHILNQSRVWDLGEIADECEELLVRYVKLDNVVDILLKARKKRWFSYLREPPHMSTTNKRSA